MPEETLFETERPLGRDAVADYLRTLADSLESGSDVTLRAGDQSVTLDPPETVEFEVKAEREGPTDGDGELSIEVELEWPENASESESADGDLRIE
ncbi:amphi-Trp domain-containing protein [Halomicroarcula limicola]|uniref:Amphi-Trp domain-containing protein n=1 Tax=Haloarcula limicola TaxID=1429915 RepID=A0A8J7Y6V3_9EURY|nr:amphi-Trp domain-containing protein [Halomicroarcula limicola]MBV0922764.1 amphi-Trp domain-containing protein [Halomicroarcula limicola]